MKTMKQAAIEIGVTPQTMVNWNTGKTPINPEAFKKLYELGIPKDVLINPTRKG